MLSSSITLHRKAKDGQKGNDGIGVKNADVMFAVSLNNKSDASKISDSDWKTNFSDLTLKENGYVWTCTKITYTSGNPIYTGKYCLGECYDFASVQELYALSDDNSAAPADGAFDVSYKATKGKYLWTCSRVVYTNNIVKFINKKCITYFAKDGVNGTSFTPMGTAMAYYAKASLIPSGYKAGEVYLVDKNDVSLPNVNAPCVITVMQISSNMLSFSSRKSDTGEAYRIGTNLWVNNGTKWVDFGDIQGPKGDDGEDALDVVVTPAPVIFTAEDASGSNSVNISGYQEINVLVRRGNEILSYPDDYGIKLTSVENFELGSGNKNFAYQGVSSNILTFLVYADGVLPKKYTYGDEEVSYPASYASVNLTITLNDGSGVSTVRTINIQVDFTKHYGSLHSDVNGLQATYGELTGKDGRLEKMESSIKANANSISSKVEKAEYENYKGTVSSQYSQILQQYNSVSLTVSSLQKGLEDTGISITDKTIKLTADNFGVYNNSGEQTMSIDADGNLVTSGSAKIKGSIEANDGRIGSFNIENYTDKIGFRYYALSATHEEFGVFPEGNITLSYNGIYSRTGQGGDSSYVYIGRVSKDDNGIDWSQGILHITGDTTGSKRNDSFVGIKIVLTPRDGQTCNAIEVNGGDIFSSDGDFKADAGSFIGGFCDKIMSVTDSTISNKLIGDNVSAIICRNTSKSVTLNLPKNPKTGMTFKVYQTGATVNFNGNGYMIYSKGHDYPDKGVSVWNTSTKNQMSIFVFDGEQWFVGFMNG